MFIPLPLHENDKREFIQIKTNNKSFMATSWGVDL